MHRIFEFPMHSAYPSVAELQVHLPNEHQVTISEGVSNDDLDRLSRTTLTAFFDLCHEHPEETADLLYLDVSSHYTWRSVDRVWKKRAKGHSIGRAHFASPTAGERYFLRLLLHHVKSPKSYEDLRTFEGRVYESFREAAVARMLLHDESHYDECMQEAATFQTGRQLRQLFATLLLNESVGRSRELWLKYAGMLGSDARHALAQLCGWNAPTTADEQSWTLNELDALLRKNDKTLTDFGLPTPEESFVVNRVLCVKKRATIRRYFDSNSTRIYHR
jgi:hypothetical protein